MMFVIETVHKQLFSRGSLISFINSILEQIHRTGETLLPMSEANFDTSCFM